MWTYTITSGAMQDPTGAVAGHGYSGHGEGLNNPSFCNVSDVGPLPPGMYTIGKMQTDEHVGKDALPLTPDPANVMYGRAAFFIHGDNPELHHTASDGCIIQIHPVRMQIAVSPDRQLLVQP